MFTSTVKWLFTAPVNAGGEEGQEVVVAARQTSPGGALLKVAVITFSRSVLRLSVMLTQVLVPDTLLCAHPDWNPIGVPSVCPTTL